MKHARPDYNRIQDPAGLIPADEPVFLLRGQDALAPQAVRFYADKAAEAGLEDIARLSGDQAKAMLTYQQIRTVKMPDLSLEVTQLGAPFNPLRDRMPGALETPLDRVREGLRFMREKSAEPADRERLSILLEWLSQVPA